MEIFQISQLTAFENNMFRTFFVTFTTLFTYWIIQSEWFWTLTWYCPWSLDVSLEKLSGGRHVELGAGFPLAVIRYEFINPLSTGCSDLPAINVMKLWAYWAALHCKPELEVTCLNQGKLLRVWDLNLFVEIIHCAEFSQCLHSVCTAIDITVHVRQGEFIWTEKLLRIDKFIEIPAMKGFDLQKFRSQL